MSKLVDSLIALGIITIFFYFIYMRLKQKHPTLGERMDGFFPFLKSKAPESSLIKEESQQKWIEKREIL